MCTLAFAAPRRSTPLVLCFLAAVIGSAKGRRVLNKMTQREQEYLEAHNVRRMRYHGEWDKPYVPLKWSLKLKERSQAVSPLFLRLLL